jgi:hypothetical protein
MGGGEGGGGEGGGGEGGGVGGGEGGGEGGGDGGRPFATHFWLLLVGSHMAAVSAVGGSTPTTPPVAAKQRSGKLECVETWLSSAKYHFWSW